ncbi:TNG2-like protein [Mya arenaria]|uniref:TNG2-like protein n=1 Tax=Mya arenaria TaxID=6604 RepID=A0ABY7E4S9_MYAAR|nr:TNG2-like protein [Mya arenaria]
MCLLFMYTGDGSVGYKLVLANNRDEFWPRPTDTLKTRGDPQHQWIGGMDLEPGREGGTWLGISRTGRLACLLNILELQRPEARGRGGLVRDFITSDLTADDYLKMIADSGEQYNPFHLIVADLRHFPDERLAAQFAATGKKTDGRLIEERSAVNVFSPHVKYGTRLVIF